MLGSFLVGKYLFSWIGKLVLLLPSVNPRFDGNAATKSLILFLQDLSARPVLIFLAICSVSIFAASLVVMLKPRARFVCLHPGFPAFIFALGGLFSAVASLALAFYLNSMTVRYQLALFIAPSIALAFLLIRLSPNYHAIGMLLAFFALIIIAPESRVLKTKLYQYPVDLSCLDNVMRRFDVQSGYADYWNSKYVSYLSRQQVRINQILQNGGKWLWIANDNWYAEAESKQGRHEMAHLKPKTPSESNVE